MEVRNSHARLRKSAQHRDGQRGVRGSGLVRTVAMGMVMERSGQRRKGTLVLTHVSWLQP